MIAEVGPLKFLVEREVVDVGTEISTTVPMMDNNPEKILIETPLRISFDLYMLLIYNRWTFIGEISKRIQDLKGQKLKSIRTISQTFELGFNSADVIQIDMSDNGYLGPEALVLHGPNNLIVVWN